MQLKYVKGFRSFWPIDVTMFVTREPWAPYIFMDPPTCPRCHKWQGGLLVEEHYKSGGTLWRCWNGCGQRYWTSY